VKSQERVFHDRGSSCFGYWRVSFDRGNIFIDYHFPGLGGKTCNADAFDAHVNGVAHFLDCCFRGGYLACFKSFRGSTIDLQRPVGYSDSEDPLIHFYLREGPPSFSLANGPAGRVHCYFQFDEGMD
jgi:hypothetical protein